MHATVYTTRETLKTYLVLQGLRPPVNYVVNGHTTVIEDEIVLTYLHEN